MAATEFYNKTKGFEPGDSRTYLKESMINFAESYLSHREETKTFEEHLKSIKALREKLKRGVNELNDLELMHVSDTIQTCDDICDENYMLRKIKK